MSAKTPLVGIDHLTVVPVNAGVEDDSAETDDNAETDETDESAETLTDETFTAETLDA